MIVIPRRGEPLPNSDRKKGKFQLPDLSHIWNTFPQLSADSTLFIEEDREDVRRHADAPAVRKAISAADSLAMSAWSISEVSCVFLTGACWLQLSTSA